MAHTCPECGSKCTCRGDWSDVILGEDVNCLCCIDLDDEELDDYFDDDEDYEWDELDFEDDEGLEDQEDDDSGIAIDPDLVRDFIKVVSNDPLNAPFSRFTK
jgi:hypothetical protein